MEKKILIVDDEQDVLTVLEKALAAEGYIVFKADNGADALALAEAEQPDIVVLDVLMPGMDGGEVARQMRQMPEIGHIPVMFLTGMFPKRAEAEQGRMVAGCMMFDKPYDILQLITAIERVTASESVMPTL